MTEARQPQTKGTEMSEDLARQLREAGRDDLADQLEHGAGEVPTDDPDPNEVFLRQIRAKAAGQWTTVPAFGDEV